MKNDRNFFPIERYNGFRKILWTKLLEPERLIAVKVLVKVKIIFNVKNLVYFGIPSVGRVITPIKPIFMSASQILSMVKWYPMRFDRSMRTSFKL